MQIAASFFTAVPATPTQTNADSQTTQNPLGVENFSQLLEENFQPKTAIASTGSQPRTTEAEVEAFPFEAPETSDLSQDFSGDLLALEAAATEAVFLTQLQPKPAPVPPLIEFSDLHEGTSDAEKTEGEVSAHAVCNRGPTNVSESGPEPAENGNVSVGPEGEVSRKPHKFQQSAAESSETWAGSERSRERSQRVAAHLENAARRALRESLRGEDGAQPVRPDAELEVGAAVASPENLEQQSVDTRRIFSPKISLTATVPQKVDFALNEKVSVQLAASTKPVAGAENEVTAAAPNADLVSAKEGGASFDAAPEVEESVPLRVKIKDAIFSVGDDVRREIFRSGKEISPVDAAPTLTQILQKTPEQGAVANDADEPLAPVATGAPMLGSENQREDFAVPGFLRRHPAVRRAAEVLQEAISAGEPMKDPKSFLKKIRALTAARDEALADFSGAKPMESSASNAKALIAFPETLRGLQSVAAETAGLVNKSVTLAEPKESELIPETAEGESSRAAGTVGEVREFFVAKNGRVARRTAGEIFAGKGEAKFPIANAEPTKSGDNNFLHTGSQEVSDVFTSRGTGIAERLVNMNSKPASTLAETSTHSAVLPEVRQTSGAGAPSTAPSQAEAARNLATSVVREIQAAIERNAAGERTRVDIHLQSFDQENIRVQLQWRDGYVQATIRTESVELQQAMTREWETFAPRANEKGIKLAAPTFESGAHGDGTASFSQQQGRRFDKGRDLDTFDLFSLGSGGLLARSRLVRGVAAPAVGSEVVAPNADPRRLSAWA